VLEDCGVRLWVHLRLCGLQATFRCCDGSSPTADARKHFRKENHPIIEATTRPKVGIGRVASTEIIALDL